MKNFTIIFDGNHFLHKTFFICDKIKNANQKQDLNFIEDPEGDKNLLLWKLATDFSAEVRRFKEVGNRIVYTVDSSSWRKYYQSKKTEYKSNRSKTSDINWDKVYEVHNEFIESIKQNGSIISRVPGAEGDDLIFAWSTYLNQKEQNCIIISGDNDLLQLVNLDKSSNAITIYFNKFNKKIFVFPRFWEWIEKGASIEDIFSSHQFLEDDFKRYLKNAIKDSKIETKEIPAMEYVFKKILIGDAGDNVPPLYSYTKESKGKVRKYKVSELMATKTLEAFKKNHMFVNQMQLFDDEAIKEICDLARTFIKIPKEITDQEIKDRWIFNRDMVYLHKKCIPLNIMEKMNSNVELSFSKTLSDIHIDKEFILQKTSWEDQEISQKEESLYKGARKSKTSNVKIVEQSEGEFDPKKWDLL